jgi:hypothetical protein
MTYLLEEHTGADTALIVGGMSGLETYDELARERAAREDAEATAAQLAEMIATENLRVLEVNREVAELRALVDSERTRADNAERELGKLLMGDLSLVPPPPLWEQIKSSLTKKR